MYTFRTDISKEEFDAFAGKHAHHSIMQSSAWAAVKQEWNHLYCGVYKDGSLVAGALLLIRSLPLGMKFGYMPRGPLLGITQPQLCKFFFEQLRQFGKKQRFVSIKFDPNVFHSYSIAQKEEAQQDRFPKLVQGLSELHIKHKGYLLDMYEATQPRFQLCYTGSGELDSFPKKTREKITYAMEHGVEIERVDVQGVEDFSAMIAYTEKRQGIVLRDSAYFKTMMESFQDRAILLLAYINHLAVIELLTKKKDALLAEYEALPATAAKRKETLAKQQAKVEKNLQFAKERMAIDGSRVLVSGLLLVRDQTTTELLYSGLNDVYRQYYAAYLLRYEAIRWAKEQGCERFNFGGVQGSLDDGLFEFKSSFHPQIDVYAGEFDLVIRTLPYIAIEQILPILKQWKLYLARKGKS